MSWILADVDELMYHDVCCLYSEGINNEYLVEENKLDSSDEDVFLLEICYILRVHNKENIGAAGASIWRNEYGQFLEGVVGMQYQLYKPREDCR